MTGGLELYKISMMLLGKSQHHLVKATSYDESSFSLLETLQRSSAIEGPRFIMSLKKLRLRRFFIVRPQLHLEVSAPCCRLYPENWKRGTLSSLHSSKARCEPAAPYEAHSYCFQYKSHALLAVLLLLWGITTRTLDALYLFVRHTPQTQFGQNP